MNGYLSVIGPVLFGAYALSELLSPRPNTGPSRFGLLGQFEKQRGFYALLAVVAANALLFTFSPWPVAVLALVAELVGAFLMIALLRPRAEWLPFALGIFGFGLAWLAHFVWKPG
jgi:hypothetical protein